MHYLATIRYSYTDSYSMSFDTEKDATNWLDTKNNNAEYHTTITIMDNNWNEVDSYVYTEGEK